MHSKTTLIGGVGTDPEIIVFENGNKLAKITLATSIYWKDKQSGERKEKTTWHNIQFGGPLAGIIESYVQKGHRLFIKGEIDNYSYDDKDGNKRYASRIRCNKMTMLTSKSESGSQDASQSLPNQSTSTPVPQPESTDSDDLPF